MLPEHLDLLHAVHGLSLTPDGETAVVSVLRPDLASDSYRGGLWAVPTAGGLPVRLTNGERDDAPAVSPDGQRVAFLRAGKDAAPQVHLTGIAGGEPVCLTDHPLGAGAPVWSPDGSRLAYSARVPEPGRYGTADPDHDQHKPSPEAEPARLVTELAYRSDGVGYTRDRRQHVFVVDVPPTDTTVADLPTLPLVARQLTAGDRDDELPAWSPDGSLLAFVSASHGSRESDLRSAVHVVRADSSAPVATPVAVTGGDLAVDAVDWLPDGRLVLVATEVGAEGRDFVGRSGALWTSRQPADPGTTLLELLAFTGDELEIEGGPGALLATGDRVLVRDVRRGGVRLLSIDPQGQAAPEVILDGELVVGAHAVSSDGSTVAVVAADQDRSGDLGLVRRGGIDWLTDVSAPLRETGIRPRHALEAQSRDGHPVHGWVVLPDPETYGAGPHPVLLSIHGGPHSQYDWALFDEAQVYAGAGYAVVMCNPRGSSGHGPEHARAVRHALGTVDADDVLAFLDHALADASLPLDATRQGVMGGSYGGYLTALLTTRTQRFAAAVVERGYLDATSFVGSSDIGWFFPGEYHGSPEAMREQSPMSHVGAVTTPTLVIHSEADWRCPVEQGQRWFTSLRSRGIRSELLLFPGEGHELSRSGRPRHRRQRFEHILRWWAEQLPVG